MDSDEDQLDREHYKNLIKIHRKHLRGYENQRARGLLFPFIDTEIERLKGEIMDLEHKLCDTRLPANKLDDLVERPKDTPESTLLHPVRNYRPGMAPGWSFSVQQSGAAWVFDGRDVVIFGLKSDDPVERWHLPQVPWKTWLPQIWQNGLVYADWAGNLCRFARSSGGRRELLYEARYSDVPFHRLTVGPQGQLVAATWNGRIFVWNQLDKPSLATAPLALGHLPIHLLPCTADQIAYTDQSNILHVLASDGQELWRYQVQAHIDAVWSATTDDGRLVFFFLLEGQRIARVVMGELTRQELALRSRVSSLGHLPGGETLLALEEGGWEWFSWSTFRTVTPQDMPRTFVARRCYALFNPYRSANRIGIGLDDAGLPFATEEQELRQFALPSARDMALDQSGRFLYLAFDDHLEVYRNPVFFPLPCKLQLVEVAGDLEVGRFQELHFRLRNSGASPIGSIRAQLSSWGDYSYILAAGEAASNQILEPGAEVELTISAKSSEAGSLRSLLQLTLEDEAGPPSTTLEIDFRIVSRPEQWQRSS